MTSHRLVYFYIQTFFMFPILSWETFYFLTQYIYIINTRNFNKLCRIVYLFILILSVTFLWNKNLNLLWDIPNDCSNSWAFSIDWLKNNLNNYQNSHFIINSKNSSGNQRIFHFIYKAMTHHTICVKSNIVCELNWKIASN